MRRLFALSFTLAISLSALAQMQPPSSMTPARPAATTAPGSASLPSKQVVDSFLQHMFGYNPNLKFQILSIQPSQELPGFGEVLVGVGQSLAKLYITPDGKHAIQGAVMPFGPDPFAAARATLAKAAGPSRGPANAPVTIVEFSDLECPHCAKAQPVLEKLLADEANVHVIYEPFPLPQHTWAAKAAAYALCVDRSDKAGFWKFVDAVYQNQVNIDGTNAEAKLTGLAAEAGANGPQAAACAATPAIQKQVEASVALGQEVGVTGTPTFYINGRMVQNISDMPYEQLKALVDYAAQQGSVAPK